MDTYFNSDKLLTSCGRLNHTAKKNANYINRKTQYFAVDLYYVCTTKDFDVFIYYTHIVKETFYVQMFPESIE